MKKKRELPAAAPETKAATPQIPDDLKNKVNALNAIFHCKTLLQIAPFTQPNWKAAADGIAFLDSLHANTLDQVKKHPQGHMVTIQEVNG